jgi:ACS family hexuronate transporter-like MFS transporter
LATAHRGRFYIRLCVGLLAAGRFVDKVGTRIGYMVIMAVWSLSAMGHALANSVFEFGIARFFLGLGESGNFPAAIKTVRPSGFRRASARWPQASSIPAPTWAPSWLPLIVPWVTIHYGWHAAFLVTGIFSALWICCGSANTASLLTTPHSPAPNFATSIRKLPSRWDPPPVGQVTGPYRQTWAFTIAKFLTDPIWWFYLFWLPSSSALSSISTYLTLGCR